MCGIAGIFGISGEPVGAGEVKSMCDAIIPRGPDDEGYYIHGNVGLGMRRLSIIDVAHGQQPVWNEDETICVVLNGEIYNFREIRRDLSLRGHCFRTSSDTEVIVHLYEEYGDECLDHLQGMFAFALWDSRQQRLLVARDRLGIKPLFYGEFDGRLVFGSELKSLLKLPAIERQLNWSAVGHLFSFLSTSAQESIIDGVHKLEPGHFITVERGLVQVRRYWDVAFQPDHYRSEQQTIEELRALLEDAVRMCMISDVPLGAFLSGGLDSSSVVALMSRHSAAPVKTFSIGFADPDYDESPYARQVAQAFGTEHHELILNPDISTVMQDMAWHLDEPFGDSSAIPTYMVSQLASQHVKVVLSGDGGDELFAGYDKYLVEQKERRYRQIPATLRRTMAMAGDLMPEGMKGRNFLRHFAYEGHDRYLDAATLFRRDEKHRLFQDGIAQRVLAADPWWYLRSCLSRASAHGDSHWLSALQYADIKNYLPLDILTKVDRMSMAHSIEARVPLLDYRLVEFAATIPADLRLHNGSTKHIFKQAMRGLLPDEIIDRRKKGFAIPLGRWFRGELDGFARDLLLSDTSRARGIFNAGYIEKLLRLHQQGRPLDLQLWTLMSFELWCRSYLDCHKISRFPPQQSSSRSDLTAMSGRTALIQ